ncbi:M48 family metalloprotease [Nocardioides convexus]|uniref:M48 family metalloprotease n=1 Tax=Nocardioides convexus TaxID=2712224 RepID=UPI00241846D7|nr:M48 family metalloprotease [Nocardioides convexus]
METRTAARRVAIGTVAVGAVGFVVLAVLRVPWDGLSSPVPASSVFSPADIERAEHYARWGRVWSLVRARGLPARGLLAGLRPPRAGVGRAGARLVVGPDRRRGRRADGGRPGGHPAVRVRPAAPGARRGRRDRQAGARGRSTWSRARLITIVSTSLAVVVLVGCARRWPRAWPAVAGALGAGLVVAGSFVYPLLIEPVFNSFEPLPDGPLRTEVLDLAHAEGVQVDDVLVADASRRTTALNAYVSGFGGTRRVVLYDTLVDGTPREEVLSVVAHELAHAKYDDVVTGTALGAAGALAGIGLLGLLVPLGERRGREAVPRVPAVLALAALATVLSAPLQNSVSRQIENRADQTALEQTRDPQAFVALQRRLALRSHADPTPPAWSQFWFGSHPTVLQRIGLARAQN